MKQKPVNIIILGSTGSVGTQTLEVIKKHRSKFNVAGLVCNSNKSLLQKQAKLFHVNKKNTILATVSRNAIYELIKKEEVEVVVNAISGEAGLKPSIETLKAGKILILANKESVVLEGAKLNQLAKKHKTKIFPLDSEHHAIMRLLKTENLEKYNSQKIKKITLTCSGGPFFGFTSRQLESVTSADALKNPNWEMGDKILIESATLLNKGFEIIEAHHLFGCPLVKIDAIIDRKSFVHAIVEFVGKAHGRKSSNTLALAYKPDMRIVIEDTLLNYPANNKKLKFLTDSRIKNYPFKKIDHKTFPAIKKIIEAYKKGKIKIFYKQSEKNIKKFLKDEMAFEKIVP